MNINKKIEELFKNGCHLGHQKNKIHPKAKKYIYTIENGVSIIDLTQTVEFLEKAKKYIYNLSENKKTLLVVGTKKIFSNFIKEFCQEREIPYVNLKWPAGLLTNFETLTKNVEKLKKMKKDKEERVWNKLVKHERLKLERKLNKLEKFYGGIELLKKLPDALFIIDIKKEKNAFKEALAKKVPVIAIVDTNVNSENVDYPIPANDDSLSSIQYLIQEILNCYSKK